MPSSLEARQREALVAMLVPLTMLASRLDPQKESRTLERIGALLKLVESTLDESGGAEVPADRPIQGEEAKAFNAWRKRVQKKLPGLARRVFELRGKSYPGCGFHWDLERQLGVVVALTNDYDRTFTLAGHIVAEVRVEELYRCVREAELGASVPAVSEEIAEEQGQEEREGSDVEPEVIS